MNAVYVNQVSFYTAVNHKVTLAILSLGCLCYSIRHTSELIIRLDVSTYTRVSVLSIGWKVAF